MKLTLLLIFFIFSFNVLAKKQLRLLSEIPIINEQRLTLSHLLKKDKDIENVLSQIENADLGSVPLVGETKKFTRLALSQIIRKWVPEKIRTEFNIHIPKEAIVFKAEKILSEDILKSKLIENWISDCSKCKFKITRFSLPNAKNVVSWNADFKKEIPRGSFNFPIHIKTVGSKKRRTYWVSGEVQVRSEVLVLARNVGFNERVQPYDVTLKEKDITYSNKDLALKSEVVGNKLTRPHNVNEIIYKSKIYREKALNQGDVVSVKAGNSAWQVSVAASAQQSGFIGDIIKMKNLESGKIFSARVVAKGEAIVE